MVEPGSNGQTAFWSHLNWNSCQAKPFDIEDEKWFGDVDEDGNDDELVIKMPPLLLFGGSKAERGSQRNAKTRSSHPSVTHCSWLYNKPTRKHRHRNQLKNTLSNLNWHPSTHSLNNWRQPIWYRNSEDVSGYRYTVSLYHCIWYRYLNSKDRRENARLRRNWAVTAGK